MPSRLSCFARNFFDRRPRWGPTWRGWILLAAVAAVAAIFFVRLVHPFLAVNESVDAEILVIEGWIPEYALRRCTTLIRTGAYQHILTVGGPVSGASSPAEDDDTYAYVAASTLTKMGVKPATVVMVPTKSASRDRTFHCALDVRRWLEDRRLSPRGINIVTLGPHARRTRLLFRSALSKQVQVGIIAMDNQEYDPAHWWRYSEGVKEIISESAAYIYARFRFVPYALVVCPWQK
jgi:hypothetical protein